MQFRVHFIFSIVWTPGYKPADYQSLFVFYGFMVALWRNKIDLSEQLQLCNLKMEEAVRSFMLWSREIARF